MCALMCVRACVCAHRCVRVRVCVGEGLLFAFLFAWVRACGCVRVCVCACGWGGVQGRRYFWARARRLVSTYTPGTQRDKLFATLLHREHKGISCLPLPHPQGSLPRSTPLYHEPKGGRLFTTTQWLLSFTTTQGCLPSPKGCLPFPRLACCLY